MYLDNQDLSNQPTDDEKSPTASDGDSLETIPTEAVIIDDNEVVVDTARRLMILPCYGEVNTEMAIDCCAFCMEVMVAVAKFGPDNIVVMVTINSPGGHVDSAMDIFDRLTALPCRVITEISGQASSAAVLIAQAGDWRRIMRHARLRLHLGSLYAKNFSANYQEMNKYARAMHEDQRRYNRIIAERCNHDEATVAGWCEREQEFSATGAKTVYLVDEIVPAARHRRASPKPRRPRKSKK